MVNLKNFFAKKNITNCIKIIHKNADISLYFSLSAEQNMIVAIKLSQILKKGVFNYDKQQQSSCS